MLLKSDSVIPRDNHESANLTLDDQNILIRNKHTYNDTIYHPVRYL